MNNQEFIKFAAKRFGVDEYVAETFVDMFAETLQELINAGQSVTIDEIGEFQTTPLFPEGFNPKNNSSLANLHARNIVTFKPSNKLIGDVA